MEKENCCGHRVKERSTAEYKDLINRLNRIEGQVRGIKKMVENNAYCPDILVQSAAVSAAMSSCGNPVSVKVRKGVRTGRPIISQCPLIVSLPALTSSSLA